jgi:heptosyltransferase-2
MSSILVVQTAWLGDIVLTTPLLRELKRARPEATVTVVTTPLGAETLFGLPFVDEIVVFDKKGRDRGILGTLRLARRLRRARFEVSIAAQRSFRTGLLLRASGAPLRVGFEEARGSWAYTRKIGWVAGDHAVRRYLALSAPAGGHPESADPRPELAVRSEARASATKLLAESAIGPGEPVLALAPGSIWGTKRWTPEGFAAVARAARERGLRPVLLGSPAERELCEQVASLSGAGAVVFAGRTSIPEMTALLSISRGLVTNDSGPGHVASAVGTPVIAVFGPTVPAFGYTPFGDRNVIVEHPGLECRPCHPHGPEVCPLGHHLCMREIGAERVVAALDEVLGRR